MKKLLLGIGTLAITILVAGSAARNYQTSTLTFSTGHRLIGVVEEDQATTDEPCTDEGCGNEDVCTKDIWKCDAWSACSSDTTQKRSCTLDEDCPDVQTAKPAEIQNCAAPENTAPLSTTTADKTAKKPEEKPATEPLQHEVQESAQSPEPTKDDQEEAKKAAAAKEAAKLEASRKADAVRKAEQARKAAEEEKQRTPEVRAEAEAQKQAMADLVKNLNAEEEKNKNVETVISQTPAFSEIFVTRPVALAALITDINGNGIPDHLETFPARIDPELVHIQAELNLQKAQLIKDGKTAEEAKQIVNKALEKKKVEKKVKIIREASKKQYGIEIKSSSQGTEKEGTSDEVAILLGLNPKENVSAKATLLPLEKKLLRIQDTSAVLKKCAMNVGNGNQLSSQGFTVIAACPPGKSFSLVAINTKGEKTILGTKTASDNGKMVFAVRKNFSAGNFVLQIKEEKLQTLGVLPFLGLASSVGAPTDEVVQSDPVLVHIAENASVPEPVVQSVSGVDVSAGLQNIKISPTADGKIRVTGNANISTVVVGTFSSAVFTSAILADVESGSFEVVSPRSLEPGDHEVSIFAMRPEESTQSTPVKLNLSIVETAQASFEVGTTPSAQEQKRPAAGNSFPVLPVAAGVVVVSALILVIIRRRGSSGSGRL